MEDSAVETVGPLLDVRGLTVTLASGVRAVEGVDFTLGAGECLALVGESGCGKTLTALSLLRAVPEDVGRSEAERMALEGVELNRLSPAGLRRVRGGRIAMVFQDPSAALDPLFKVGEQIVETYRAHHRAGRSEAVAQALGALAAAGIPDSRRVFGSYPHQLSGGQKQRAVIAMALVTGAALLIADEPTTALDVTVERQIIELLAGLCTTRSLALLLISHNLHLVRSLARRVAVMYSGQIVECAPAAELFSAAAHPYTRALLDCIPQPDGTLRSIGGQLPAPGAWPAGCRFRDRCALAVSGCELPQALRPLDNRPGRLVRCHRAGATESGAG
ncbi:ABC transporter ATP-binding protein [bacterium]|nr:ABC transporter ATP-binding protein [bacterium]